MVRPGRSLGAVDDTGVLVEWATSDDAGLGVLLVHADPRVRERLEQALAPDMRVVGSVETPAQALTALAGHPGSVVMAQRRATPRATEALIEIAGRLDERNRVIIVLDAPEPEGVIEALTAGAHGIMSQDTREVAPAVRSVGAGFHVFDAPVAQRLAALVRGGFENPLSQRERVVLEHLAQGLTNARIAASMSVSGETVKSHVSSILRKLGAPSRLVAVDEATRRGFIAAG
ncbi:MAG: two-component system response regulator [Ilumatobacteraceae bacterium]|nr:two-component system response regulator [Ilumatobacteraceae bacterium]